MIAELAARSGRSMREIARHCSAPEIMLVLHHLARARAADLLGETHSRALAKDVSTKDPVRSYGEFTDSLRQLVAPSRPVAPKLPSAAQLAGVMSLLGIPAEKHV